MFEAGSVWRKWDLHVHLPDTRMNNQYEKKKPEKTEVDWDRFCEAIESSDVDVIGLTDYFSISSFEACVQRFRQLYPESQKFFIPNMELRTTDILGGKQHVNLHLLFNPEMNKSDFDAFCSYVNVTFHSGQRLRLSEIPTVHSSAAWESMTVVFDEVIQALDAAFASGGRRRRDSVIVVVSGKKDGLSCGKGAAPRTQARVDGYDQHVDAIFASSADRTHWLEDDRHAGIVQKHPTFKGCDAHSFVTLEGKLGKAVTDSQGRSEVNWVKADPTWQGLLQTLIEPDGRVWIGDSPFNISRESRKVITSLEFSDKSNFPERILLNPGLNSIIGSRSSGKSALLAHIAHVVIPGFEEKQKREYSLQFAGPASGHSWTECAVDVPKVLWESGATEGNVVYVPQGYLSQVGENRNDVNKLIEGFLADRSVEKKVAYEECQREISSYSKSARNFVSEMGDVWQRIISLRVKQTEVSPSRAALETEQDNINKKIQEKTPGTERATAKLAHALKLKADVENLEKNLETSEIDIFVNSRSKFHYPEPQECFSIPNVCCEPKFSLSEEELKLFASCKERIDAFIRQELTTFIQTISDCRTATYVDLQKQHEQMCSELREFEDLLEANVAVNALLPQKKRIEDALRQWDAFESEISAEKSKFENLVDELYDAALALIESNNRFTSELSVNLEEFDDIVIQAEFFEESEEFEEILKPVNLKRSKAWVDAQCALSFQERAERFPETFKALMSGEIALKGNSDPLKLLQEYVAATPKLAFVAYFDGDHIGGSKETTMSPGKRALFALTMLLSRVGAGWPLLLDQPEDDLDSRSIYETIVPFLLEQKKKRQIIMVSHNANLVVGADSELVLVANRNSTEQQNPNRRTFDFLGGSLESTKVCTREPSYLEKASVSEHVVALLDGGAEAFKHRENKYSIAGVGFRQAAEKGK